MSKLKIWNEDQSHSEILQQIREDPQKVSRANHSRTLKEKLLGFHQVSWKKRIIAIFIGLLVFIASTNIFLRFMNFQEVDGYYERRSQHGQGYVYIETNDPYSLGYMTGQALANEIFGLWKILFFSASQYDLSYNRLKEQARQYFEFLSEDEVIELSGIVNGVNNQLGLNLQFDDILLQNTWIDITYGQIFPLDYNPLGCSAIAVNRDQLNETSINNVSETRIIIAQNFDFPKIFDKTLAFVQYNLSGTVSFGLRIGASLNLPMGYNSKLTALTTIVRTNQISNIETPILVKARRAWQNATNPDQFCQILSSTDGSLQTTRNGSAIGFNIISANGTNIVEMENCPASTIVRHTLQSVKTNTFIESDLQEYLSDPFYSKSRQEELENQLLQINPENFTLLDFNHILDSNEVMQIAEKSTDIATLVRFSVEYHDADPLFQICSF